jgi:hypothetical protein
MLSHCIIIESFTQYKHYMKVHEVHIHYKLLHAFGYFLKIHDIMKIQKTFKKIKQCDYNIHNNSNVESFINLIIFI